MRCRPPRGLQFSVLFAEANLQLHPADAFSLRHHYSLVVGWAIDTGTANPLRLLVDAVLFASQEVGTLAQFTTANDHVGTLELLPALRRIRRWPHWDSGLCRRRHCWSCRLCRG